MQFFSLRERRQGTNIEKLIQSSGYKYRQINSFLNNKSCHQYREKNDNCQKFKQKLHALNMLHYHFIDSP